MVTNNHFTVLGLMSGTSLDGLDMCICNYSCNNNIWEFEIVSCKTIEYPDEIIENLINCKEYTALDFITFHNFYGKYIGKLCKNFIESVGINVNFISSHGHTIFHQPENGLTFQIGSGACIAAESNTTCISDFRVLDVALDGQGAPLVPIGDIFLFGQYDACINIGGFANISYNINGNRLAYDICPSNIVLNKISQLFNLKYDINGNKGKQGNINISLLNELNNLKYYSQNAPKSLGREWLETTFEKIIDNYNIENIDKLRTIYEHISVQIANSIDGKENILFTGGGTHNLFLMECIKNKTKSNIIIPEKNIIDYKEAVIFGFLGVLRNLKENNCLASVTGARHDNIGGVIHYILPK